MKRSHLLLSNFYERLSLTPKSSSAEIKSAFYKACMTSHPDRFPLSEKQEALAQFLSIKEAYEILGNPSKRRLYDQSLGIQTPFEGKPFDNWGSSNFTRNGQPFESE